jgi:hypothetical protein
MKLRFKHPIDSKPRHTCSNISVNHQPRNDNRDQYSFLIGKYFRRGTEQDGLFERNAESDRSGLISFGQVIFSWSQPHEAATTLGQSAAVHMRCRRIGQNFNRLKPGSFLAA